MTAPALTVALSPAQLLVAVIFTDQATGDAECDLDALGDAVAAGWVEASDGNVKLTPSGGFVAVAVCARRPVDRATRMAVLACPLCGDPGGYCGGSCQVEPEL